MVKLNIAVDWSAIVDSDTNFCALYVQNNYNLIKSKSNQNVDKYSDLLLDTYEKYNEANLVIGTPQHLFSQYLLSDIHDEVKNRSNAWLSNNESENCKSGYFFNSNTKNYPLANILDADKNIKNDFKTEFQNILREKLIEHNIATEENFSDVNVIYKMQDCKHWTD